jgi:predicted GNAT family N-acyltransferase
MGMDEIRLHLELVAWVHAAEKIKAVREAVFIREQKVPEHLEWDGQDKNSRHVVAVIEEGTVVGTGRITAEGKIGRMAVVAAWRGRGVGGAMLRKLLEVADEEGHSRVILDAQVNVRGFYRKYGFYSEGDIFMDAGIPHQRMILALSSR